MFLVVMIELFPNCVFQLYCPKDYYKQKQWNTLPVTMVTDIMNCNRLLWWLSWHSGKYLSLAILTNNEECHFSRSITCLGQTYACDYVHLNNLLDISAYRNHNVLQCKMQISHIRPKIVYIIYTTLNRYMSMIVW